MDSDYAVITVSSVQLSTDNAACLKYALQPPLLIDPNGVTTTWLRHMAAASARAGTAEVVSMHDSRLATTLELAVRFGKTLVITGAETVVPLVVNTLRRDFMLRGTGRGVIIGDKTVDVDDGFRLLLVTETADAAPPPDLQPLMTVLNFSPTRAGLESALLAATLQHEQPQLESQRRCASFSCISGYFKQFLVRWKRLAQVVHLGLRDWNHACLGVQTYPSLGVSLCYGAAAM